MLPSYSRIIHLFLIIALALVLIARLDLALTRYFDVDEFAHLHWTYLISQGLTPYRDFFFYLTPVYQWFLLPLFRLPPADTILLLARLWQFGLYLLTIILLYRITKNVTRSNTVSILALLLFSVFPMTFDKTIEIRPDMLMTFFYFFAIERLLNLPYINHKQSIMFGVLLGISTVVSQKAIPMIPAALILFTLRHPHLRLLGSAMVGLFVPAAVFLLYLSANSLTGLAWETFSHTQFIVNQGKQVFSLVKTLSPWPLVYVANGEASFPWLVNMAIWLTALAGLFFLWKQNGPFSVFAAFFALSAFVFLALFPAPYVQYFIPLSLIASLLAAITLQRIGSYLNTNVYILLVLVLLTSFFLQYRERVGQSATSAEQLGVIRDILAISKPNDTFYDMVGSYVFRPDGYFICCHPYAEFVDRLPIRLPTLRDSLIANQTKYLILDRTGQSLWLPKKEDLEFLQKKYKPSQYPKIYIRID